MTDPVLPPIAPPRVTWTLIDTSQPDRWRLELGWTPTGPQHQAIGFIVKVRSENRTVAEIDVGLNYTAALHLDYTANRHTISVTAYDFHRHLSPPTPVVAVTVPIQPRPADAPQT